MALATGLLANAQVKIGVNPTNINAASILEIESTTQGVLFPRVALANTITATLAGGLHVAGMMVYNTATAGDVTPGMYTSDGSKWVKLGGSTTPAYQNIYGKVTTVTAGSYTVAADDYAIFTNVSTGGVTITFPDLTLAEAGRTVVVFNNNASGNNTLSALILGVQTNTPLRGMELMWAGTTWVIIGK